jgi:hypothetical protein
MNQASTIDKYPLTANQDIFIWISENLEMMGPVAFQLSHQPIFPV